MFSRLLERLSSDISDQRRGMLAQLFSAMQCPTFNCFNLSSVVFSSFHTSRWLKPYSKRSK